MTRSSTRFVAELATVALFAATIALGFLAAGWLGDGTAVFVLALIAAVLLAAVFLPVTRARPEPNAIVDLGDGPHRALVLPLPLRPQRLMAVTMLVAVAVLCLGAADPAATATPFVPPIAYLALAGVLGLAFAPVFWHWNTGPLFALTPTGLFLRAAGVESVVPWSAIGNVAIGTISGTRGINLLIAVVPGEGATRSGSLLWPRMGKMVTVPTRWIALRPPDLQCLVRYYWTHPDERSLLGQDPDAIHRAIGEGVGDALTEDNPWRFTEG